MNRPTTQKMEACKGGEVGMNEMEILSELKSALEWISEDDNPNGSIAIKINSIREMIKILEKREPKPPHYTRLEYLVSGKVVEIYHPECPRCFGNGLFLWDAEIEKGQAYCKRCGQAVKWNEG